MESSPITVKRSGWIVGVLAATATLFVLGCVSSGFYVSAGGLVIAGALAFFLGSGAAAVVDSRTGRNASIVAFYLVAVLAAYLLILPAFDRSIPPDIQIAHSVRAYECLLDGEIVCLDPDGRSNFHKLLFRRDWPYFFAFDLLSLDGKDLRELPLIQRKRRLRTVMPRINSRLRYVDHVARRGRDLFNAACERDLEGVVAKWGRGSYETDGMKTSWLKIKNPQYSHMVGRRELFEARRDERQRRRRDYRRPVLALRR